MIDALLTAVQLVCLGGFGWAMFHLGQRAERRAVPPPPPPLEPVCSCGHGSGKHPGDGQHCGGTTTVRRTWNCAVWPHNRYEDQILECGCTAYDGPDPETVRMIRGA